MREPDALKLCRAVHGVGVVYVGGGVGGGAVIGFTQEDVHCFKFNLIFYIGYRKKIRN